jgi:hypothetical protein
MIELPAPDTTRPYALLSLPSSGSDWLARVICGGIDATMTSKELFNPMCNLENYDTLIKCFGCESSQGIKQIARKLDQKLWEQMSEAMEKVGPITDGVIKDNFSFNRMSWYCNRFKTFALVRSFRETFPPNRLRVLQWYDAIYESIFTAGAEDSDPLVIWARDERQFPNWGIFERAMFGWFLSLRKLLADAQRNGVPVLLYDRLMWLSDDRLHLYVKDKLGKLFPEPNIICIASGIQSTRQPRVVPEQLDKQWSKWYWFFDSLCANDPEFCRLMLPLVEGR